MYSRNPWSQSPNTAEPHASCRHRCVRVSQFSCLLSSDAAEVERATDSLAEEKDRLVAEVADSIMLAELRDLSSLVSRL